MNTRVKDRVGKRYGSWTVISLDVERSRGSTKTFWFARCDCGETRSRQATHLDRSAKAPGLAHHGGMPCKRRERDTDRPLGLTGLANRFGFTKRRVRGWLLSVDFPTSVRDAGHEPMWHPSEVAKWLATASQGSGLWGARL